MSLLVRVLIICKEKVTVLVSEFQKSGRHKISFPTGELKSLPSGIYFYSLRANVNIITKKMVLFR